MDSNRTTFTSQDQGVGPTQINTISDSNKTEPLSMVEDFGKTEPIDGLYKNEEKQEVRAVVGWLVCIKGVNKGQDFRLHDGWNYIGRSNDCDVFVDDPKVSRQRTVKIAYESRSRTFAVAPCEDTKDIAYCCDKPLYSTREMTVNDVISIGESELMFVPLCGEKFVWEE